MGTKTTGVSTSDAGKINTVIEHSEDLSYWGDSSKVEVLIDILFNFKFRFCYKFWPQHCIVFTCSLPPQKSHSL